jgi:LysR family transcriptional regulator, benzoate and cis,cis-muconate-responsive activator of ben and cat genes
MDGCSPDDKGEIDLSLFIIAVAAGHRLATAPLTDLAQLAEEDFVVCRRYEEPGFREMVEGLCREAGFTPRVAQAVEHKQTNLDLVAEGLGVSIIPRSAATPSDRVRYRQLPNRTPYLTSAVAWREDAHSEAIAVLVDIAEREAKNREAVNFSVASI